MPIAKFYFYNDLKIGFLLIVTISLMKFIYITLSSHFLATGRILFLAL
jgi:hypothetical protein